MVTRLDETGREKRNTEVREVFQDEDASAVAEERENKSKTRTGTKRSRKASYVRPDSYLQTNEYFDPTIRKSDASRYLRDPPNKSPSCQVPDDELDQS